MPASEVAVLLRKIAELNHEISLLQLGYAELNARFESLGVLAELVRREDECRISGEAGEDLVG